ncbi:ALA3 [Symbiodinium natans]|uniref:P-type phospholipid transporter n=1 Tax=Symbiodinium natans TaxID=878477 RepID=A0A812M6M3_9DINO|nr:ALA3 [Symbiodinium natans]
MVKNTLLRSVEGHMEADLPNELVGRFDGCLYLKGFPRGVPVGLKNLLLRGSTIRNTNYVIGLVVYTGNDTKVVRNSSRSSSTKRSQVEIMSNKLLIIVFLLLFLISIGCAIARANLLGDAAGFQNLRWVWNVENFENVDNLQDNPYLAILTFLIGYNNLIPISLYMTTDVVRAIQAFIMERDESMYHAQGGSHCTVRTSALCEDLGMVDFVLTDKTGTLTQNEMCFKACYVDGQTYGYWTPTADESTDAASLVQDSYGYPSDHIEKIPTRSVCWPLNPLLWGIPSDEDPHWSYSLESNVHSFFLCLATCHTAMPEKSQQLNFSPTGKRTSKMETLADIEYVMQNDPGMNGLSQQEVRQRMELLIEANQTQFRSQSPDEEALLSMARDFGFYFKKRQGNKVTINIRGQEQHYTVIMCNEFSSERKRMSVLVRQCSEEGVMPQTSQAMASSILLGNAGVMSMENLPHVSEGAYILFAKGADSVMLDRMRQKEGERPPPVMADFDGLDDMTHAMSLDADRSNEDFKELSQASPKSGDGRGKVRGARALALAAAMGSGSAQLGQFGSEGRLRPKAPSPCSSAGLSARSIADPPMPSGAPAMLETDENSRLSAKFEMPTRSAGLMSWCSRNGPENTYDSGEAEECPRKKKLRTAREQVRHFSMHGLRTLVCGQRVLPDAEAEAYIKRWQGARSSFFNRDELMNRVMDDMERDFDLLGVTAVEDKIQFGVPETVQMLLDGGMRIWMLTGDCVETAVNIASICSLIEQHSQLYYLTCEEGAARERDSESALELEERLRFIQEEILNELQQTHGKGFHYSLVLNGPALYAILEAPDTLLYKLFVTVACNSCSVIACRLSPAQKASLVELIKKDVPGNPLTLAVGDGGNDVSMIQKAHVGVGIAGAEGREAVNAADFAIGQFRFLRSLLFVHGRSNIRRIGLVIGYSFYKNFLLVITMACYAPFTGFSGTTFYNPYLIMMYNVVFTNLPIFIVGALDVDVYAPAALTLPKLYLFGVNKVYFNYRMLVAWLLRGTIHALVNYFVAAVFLGGWEGWASPFSDYTTLGAWSYWSCVVVSNSTLLLHTQVWMDWQVLISVLSVIMFPPILFIYSWPSVARIFNPSLVEVAAHLFQSLPGWLSLLLVLALSVLVELALDSWQRIYKPDLAKQVQEFQCTKKYVGEAHDLFPNPSHRGTDSSLVPIVPTNRQPPSSPVSPTSPTGTTYNTRDELLYAANLKMEKMFPAALVNSIPWSYKRSNYNQGDFQAEAAQLKEFTKHASHPPTKKPGLQLIMERHRHRREDELAPDPTACCGKRAKEWQRIISQMQWCQISLMSDVLGNKTSHEQRDATSNLTLAERLSNVTGMQLELLDLDQITDQRKHSTTATTTGHPMEHKAQSRFNVKYTTEFVYNVFTLKFRSSLHEQAFCQMFDEASRNQFFVSARVLAVLLVGFQVTKLLVFVVQPGELSEVLQSLVAIAGFVLGCEALLVPLRFESISAFHASYLTVCCCCLLILKHVIEFAYGIPGYVSDAIMPFAFCAGARMRFPQAIGVLFLHMLLLIVHSNGFLNDETCKIGGGFTTLDVNVCNDEGQLLHEFSTIQFGLVMLVGAYMYLSERFARHSFAWDDRIGSARNADRDLLKGMYPEDVVEAVRESFLSNQQQINVAEQTVSTTRTIFQERGIVTIVFIDIYAFERIVAQLAPNELVELLDRVFTQINNICQEHSIVKIETVGKTFVAAGMVDFKKKSPRNTVQMKAFLCVEAASAVLRLFTRCTTGMEQMERLSLKIGINTGQVISGVVGSQKPQFALFGDTVNTASRMMSTGQVDHIHISASTYDLVKEEEQYAWKGRKTTVKGKGEMDTYLLMNDSRRRLVSGTISPLNRAKSAPREGSMVNVGPDVLLPSEDPKTFCSMLSRARLAEAIQRFVSFCVRAYELDCLKTKQEHSLLASLVLFWCIFCLESLYIWIGDTGTRAANLQQFFNIRLPFAVICFAFIMLGGITTFWHSLFLLGGDAKQKKEQHSDQRDISDADATALDQVSEVEEEEEHTNPQAQRRGWPCEVYYFGISVVLIGTGYICAVTSSLYGLADGRFEEVSYWIYFESMFYLSAMMHLNVLRATLAAFACAFAILLPATVLGGLADFPSGLIYPSAAYILQVRVIQSLKWYQLKSLEGLRMVEKEHKECYSLLNSLLPQEVLESMQSDNLQLAYTYRDMTLLFADIVGFTKYCATHQANEAVRLVTHLFARFDDCCKLLGAYKVCTIGDAYLAVNEPKTVHEDKVLGANVLLHLAMSMLRVIVTVRNEVQHDGLDMRIGLHHGEFVAGVIGSNQLRFDIWGEDVLIGNQMESEGQPGRICCSATFVEVIQSKFQQFRFTEHKVVACSGTQRTMQSYLLDEPHGIGTGKAPSSPGGKMPRGSVRGKRPR